MAKAKKTKAMQKAKKKWVEILAPKIFNSMPIGETHVFDTREGLGKFVSVNMMALTKNPKKQGVNVKLLVTGQHEDKLTTSFVGLRMMPPVVKRIVRRGKDKIEDSFVCSTADGKKVRIKPIVITRSKVKGSVISAIRKSTKMYLARVASKLAYDKLVEDLIGFKIQRGLHDVLNPIYPVSISEIRWFELQLKKGEQITSTEVKEIKKEEAKPEEKQEVKPVEKQEEKPAEVKAPTEEAKA